MFDLLLTPKWVRLGGFTSNHFIDLGKERHCESKLSQCLKLLVA